MTTANEVWTDEARRKALAACDKWHGTPHKDRIAIVGVGIDCIKFLAEILMDAEIVDRVPFGSYTVQDGAFEVSTRLESVIETAFFVDSIPVDEMTFGDVAVFTTGRRSAHIGWHDGRDIWHALANRCVTHNDFKLWRRDIAKAYRITARGWKTNPQVTINRFMS